MSGFKLPKINIGKLLQNIKSPDRSSPTSQQAYQEAQRKRFDHQKESKFQYDIRMRKEARKRAMGTDIETHDPKSEIKGTFSTAETYTTPLVNPNDKRDQSQVQNFGIIPGMSFSEAFAQAGKLGARAGKDPFFWTNPDLEKNPEQKETKFLYDFKKEEEKDMTEQGTVPSHVLSVPAFKDLTYEQYSKDSVTYQRGAENWIKENR